MSLWSGSIFRYDVKTQKKTPVESQKFVGNSAEGMMAISRALARKCSNVQNPVWISHVQWHPDLGQVLVDDEATMCGRFLRQDRQWSEYCKAYECGCLPSLPRADATSLIYSPIVFHASGKWTVAACLIISSSLTTASAPTG